MSAKPVKPLSELVAELGRYPEEAFHFLRDGLSHAVEQVHGPSTPAQLALYELLESKEIELQELIDGYEAGQLSPRLTQAIEAAGGIDCFNRHVSGQQLSWGLRDYALQRWGLMARTVLARWGIRETLDFGRIVFAMVENGYMQKQPHDSLDDFRNVFDFREAFDEAYQPGSQDNE
jgi:uncharacterized repeat protein (TIGR04138 family)